MEHNTTQDWLAVASEAVGVIAELVAPTMSAEPKPLTESAATAVFLLAYDLQHIDRFAEAGKDPVEWLGEMGKRTDSPDLVKAVTRIEKRLRVTARS